MQKYLIILFLFFSPVLLTGQENTSKYSIQVAVGYSTFNLSNAVKHFENNIKNISRYNIPIHPQTKYPGNLIWNGKIIYKLLYHTSIYVGTGFTQTSAYSFYGDYAGTIDVVSKIKMYNFFIGIERVIYQGLIIKPYIDINVGYSNVSYFLKNSFNYYDLKEYNYYDSKEINFSNYKLGIGLGLKYELTPFHLGIQSNYRISTFEGKIDNEKNIKIDLSGIKYQIFLQVCF